MKKIFLILAAFAICSSAFAQINFSDSENIKDRYRYGEDPAWEKGFNVDFVFPMYFGASTLIGGQYTGEWTTFRNLYGDFMETSPGFSFAMDLARINYSISGNFQIYLGIRYTSELHSFRDKQIYLDNDLIGNLTPKKATDFSRYSRFGLHTWGIPAGFSIGCGKFVVSANATAEWTSRALTIYKGNYTKYNNNELKGFSNFRISYTLMAGYGGSGLFVRYSNTPLLKNGIGYNGATSLSFGVVLGI